MKFEHSFPRVGAGKWDIDTFLEPMGGEFRVQTRKTSIAYLRLIALSKAHGMFVAPRTSTPVSS
jgi:hypothetical protein